MKQSPSTRGAWLLTSAMTTLALSAADLTMSVETPYAAVAVVVGLGDLDEGHVDDRAARAEECRHLRQEDGRVVGAPLGHRGARVGADEEGVVSEALVELGLGVGRHAEGHDVDDLGVVEVLAGGQGPDERLRLTGAAADEDARAMPDPADRVCRGLDLGGVAGLPLGVAGLAHRLPGLYAPAPIARSGAFGPGMARSRPVALTRRREAAYLANGTIAPQALPRPRGGSILIAEDRLSRWSRVATEQSR